jgi:hypothetical protein
MVSWSNPQMKQSWRVSSLVAPNLQWVMRCQNPRWSVQWLAHVYRNGIFLQWRISWAHIVCGGDLQFPEEPCRLESAERSSPLRSEYVEGLIELNTELASWSTLLAARQVYTLSVGLVSICLTVKFSVVCNELPSVIAKSLKFLFARYCVAAHTIRIVWQETII